MNFNQNQFKAICHKSGPAIVLAGPGSGKTTVITHRVKNLIENEGISPEKILVVTFTKAAAVHMKHKFMEIMNNHAVDNKDICKIYPVTFGTFHSIFYRILRMVKSYGSESVVSERMKYDFLKEIVIRLRIDIASMPEFIQNISSEISRFKGNMHDLHLYEPKCCNKDIFDKIIREYEKVLEVERKIDFEDMLVKCYRLFLERPSILRQWQEVFQYVLIDEFQDINKIQYEIIKLIVMPENNIFIVGDDDQSIYGFRGACPKIMFQFKEDFRNAGSFLLNVNYRSAPEIIKLSENLIKHNNNRFDKNIISTKDGKGFTDIRKFRNHWEEWKYLCRQIKKYIYSGVKSEDIAILVRNNNQIANVAEFLKNEQLDIRGQKNKNMYQGMVAKDVIAYIKAALCIDRVSLRENENLIYILNKPGRLINRQVIGRKDMDFEELKRVYSHNREILRNVEQLQFHLKMIAGLNPSAAMTYIRHGVGYEKYLYKYSVDKKIQIKGLLNQFDMLQNQASGFDTLKEWMSYIDDQSMGDSEVKSGIHLMTMHGAKGLEFTAVFIVDVNQGIIPSSKSVRERDYQEERRLFYVAMTRAAQFLNIYCTAESLGCSVEASMFIEEALDEKWNN